MADDWITPTGASGTGWSSAANSKDDNNSTYAYEYNVTLASYGNWLTFTVGSMLCDKIRFDALYNTDILEIIIEVYYEAGWHQIYIGSYTNHAWVEKSIPAGQKTVTQARVKFYNSTGFPGLAKMYEFDFNQVASAVVIPKMVHHYKQAGGL